MTVSLSVEMKRLIERQIERQIEEGRYAAPEEVVQAALAALEQLDDAGGFAPGELATLVQAGEASLHQHGFVSLAAQEALLATTDG